MELVVWLEGRVKSPGNADTKTYSMEEEKPVSIKHFRNAINMLKEKGEEQSLTNLHYTRKNTDIMMKIQEELLEYRTESRTATDTLAEEKWRRRKHNDVDKNRRKEEREASDISENATRDMREAGEKARSSDNKKHDEAEDEGRMREKLRMEQEIKQKEKRDEIYQEMLRRTNMETE
eukprot:11713322-Heterocapsa_arctica.AAC.1